MQVNIIFEGADVGGKHEGGSLVFRYPSYIQHIMGYTYFFYNFLF